MKNYCKDENLGMEFAYDNTMTFLRNISNSLTAMIELLHFLRDNGEFAYSNSFDIDVSPMGSGHGNSVEKPKVPR